MPVPADPSGDPRLTDVLARLPRLTVHLVDLPAERGEWVADAQTLTCWLRKTATLEQRATWAREAGLAILAFNCGSPVERPAPPRLRSVPPRS